MGAPGISTAGLGTVAPSAPGFGAVDSYRSSDLFHSVPKTEVVGFIGSQLRSDLILQARQNPNSSVAKAIDRLARHPLFVYADDGRDKAQRLNFTSWAHVLSLRPGQYQSDVLSDLYLLHEMRHMVTLQYNPGISLEKWVERIKLNEKVTTLYSEALIYFEFPELRKQFPIKHIWVDRYLEERVRLHPRHSNHEFYRANPRDFEKELLRQFLLIDRKAYHEMDDMEMRSAEYSAGNDQFARIWALQNQDIESHMQQFFALSDAGDEEAAIQFHLDWLNKRSSNDFIFSNEARDYMARSKYVKESLHSRVLPNDASLDFALRRAAQRFRDLVDKDLITMTPQVPVTEQLLKFGITATVYAHPTAEARAVAQAIYADLATQGGYEDMFGQAYTRQQDPKHMAFLEAFKDWSSPVVSGLDGYGHAYPANGSSEPIKDTIAHFLKTVSADGTVKVGTLHMLKGDYEGANAIAAGHGIPVVMHERTEEGLKALYEAYKPGDYVYLSQPSAIDGNVWNGYQGFVDESQKRDIQLIVDLCYVGSIDREYNIDVSAPNIKAVFFSLSKSFGTYYQRIGGAFYREPMPSLIGNKWFKNLPSLAIGTELLKRFDVRSIPSRYKVYQQAAVDRINSKLGLELQPSDVVLLAHQLGAEVMVRQRIEGGEDFLLPLLRGESLRLCLTPLIDALSAPSSVYVVEEEVDYFDL